MRFKVSSPVFYLLVIAFAALIAEVLHLDPVVIFVLSAIGLIPLAKRIGDATEELAVHTGLKVGGLLNATPGNAAKLIIALAFLVLSAEAGIAAHTVATP